MARAAMFALIAAVALAGPAGTAGSDLPPKAADAASAALDAAPISGQAANPPVLDYDFFVKRVQPIFLSKRKGLARCYVCHSQATNFRLQRLATGASAWSEAESRLNFDATKRFAVPGDPMESRLVTMPLESSAGGIAFHPGGKHWVTREDTDCKTISAWVMGAK